MPTRIIFGLAFFISVFSAPWWLSFSFGLILLGYYKNFWELPVAALCIDTLFGTPVTHFFGFTYVLTLSAILLFVLRRTIGARLFMRGSTV